MAEKAQTKMPAAKAVNSKKEPKSAIKPEEISVEQTGKIDLHLKSPEDVEITIKKELEKLDDSFQVIVFNPDQNKLSPEKKVELLKEMGEALTITDENDKKGYEKVDTFRKMVVKVRTGLAAKHKLLKENYLKVSRALDAKKNDLTKLVEEIEEEQEKKLKAIDDIIAEKERQEAAAKKEKLDNRVENLKAAGLKFTESGYYSIGETIAVDIVTIENLTEDQFLDLLGKVKTEKYKINFQEKKRLQREKVERYLFERQKRKQDAEAKRLKDLQEEQERERFNSRIEVLEAIGMQTGSKIERFYFENNFGQISIYFSEIKSLSSDDWKSKILNLKAEIARLKNKSEELKIVSERTKRIQALGYVYNEFNDRFELLGGKVFFQAKDAFETEDFEKWFELSKNLAETTLAEEKRLKDEKEKLRNDRVTELINGFGFFSSKSGLFKKFKYATDTEASATLKEGLFVSWEEIDGYNEPLWIDYTDKLTVAVNEAARLEKKIADRIAEEEEQARKALLSEKELVNEYLLKLFDIQPPTGIKTEYLSDLISEVQKPILAAIGSLSQVVTD